MNVICIMMDTLNRNWLSPYGAPAFPKIQTPNFQRLAERSVTMLNHYIGSAPTMPARRDLYSGRLGLPWRDWGPHEPFDPHLSLSVQLAGTHASRLVCDNAHFWNAGGGFLHTRYDTFELIRGAPGDRWKSRPNRPHPEMREMMKDKGFRADQWIAQTEAFAQEADYHGPQVFGHAAEWVDKHHRFGPFFLMVEAFDPHEPWDCPEPYRTMYLDDPSLADPSRGWTIWPVYGRTERYSPEQMEFLRAQYGGVLTMCDAWLGRLLDTLDRRKLWETTVVALTSDHGFYLGENNLIGKNDMLVRPVLAHIPLLIHWPGSPLEGKTCAALSTTIDLHPTLLEAMDVEPDPRVQGRSLAPVLRGEAAGARQACLYGYFGRGQYCTDGRWLLCKGDAGHSDARLYAYGVHFDAPYWSGPRSQVKLQEGPWEAGDFLPHAGRPVFRRLLRKGGRGGPPDESDSLFDLSADYACENNLWDSLPAERERMLAQMRREMREVGFPEEHWPRLGL